MGIIYIWYKLEYRLVYSCLFSKGSAVIRMMWFFLGKETFQQGLSVSICFFMT